MKSVICKPHSRRLFRRGWASLAALAVVALLLGACRPPVPTLVPTLAFDTATPTQALAEETETPNVERVIVTATPGPTPAPANRMVVCMLQEPLSLYPAVSNLPATLAVQQALYDGLIDSHSYQYQPVAFAKLPYVPDGDAALETVTVGIGDRVYDAATSQVVTLAADSQVLLNQVDGPAVEADFSASPTATTVRQWAQWTQVPGLTWEDGTPVTSADALFAFEV